ncbi:MAG: hypothetical protein PUK04_00700, partial [Bacteroidales bacterium]|nr:hypothetical protein [Bacteroidales bacterium]
DFVKWSDDVTGDTRKFYITRDTTLNAIFAPHKFTVDATPNNALWGKVIGGGQYEYNTSAHLEAQPNPHYHLVGWSDGYPNLYERDTVVESNISLEARFAIDTFKITVSTSNPAVSEPVKGAGEYPYGTVIEIEARSTDDSYRFVQWEDGNKENPRRVAVTEHHDYEAEYARFYRVSVQPFNQDHGYTLGSGWFAENHYDSIRAVPAAGYCFYRWLDGNTTSGCNQIDPTDSQQNPRKFVVTTDTAFVAEFVPLPKVQIRSSAMSICYGDTIRLENALHAANYKYSWQGQNIILDEDSAIVATPTDTTTYVVEVGNEALGCTVIDSIRINVVALPVASITANDTICAGDSILVRGAGGYRYLWNTGQQSAVIKVAPEVDTTFWLLAYNKFGCQGDTVYHHVHVHPLPVIQVSASDSVLCVGDSTTLRVDVLDATDPDGYTYRWMAGSRLITAGKQREVRTCPPVTTTYYCYAVNDTTGCVKVDSVLINVNKLPEVVLRSSFDPTQIFCAGDAAILTVIPTDDNNPTDLDYAWFRDGQSIGSNQQTLIDYPEAATNGRNDTTYTYNVVVKTKRGLCESISQGLEVTVHVGALPKPPIEAFDADGNSLLINDTICHDKLIRLYAKQEDRALFTYRWYSQTGEDITNDDDGIDDEVWIRPANTSTYTLAITNNLTGCVRLIARTIYTMPMPAIVIVPSGNHARSRAEICVGDSAVVLKVLSTDSIQLDSRYSISWYADDNLLATDTNSIAVTTADAQNKTYRVEVVNKTTEHVKEACPVSAEYVVAVLQAPDPIDLHAYVGTEQLADTVRVCPGASVTLKTMAVDGMRYSWSDNFGNVYGGNEATEITVTPTRTTTYTVSVINAGGCSYTAARTVYVNNKGMAIGGNLTMCPAGSTKVWAVGMAAKYGDKFQWSDLSTKDTLTVTTAGNYHVYVTKSGITTFAQFSVVEASLPEVEFGNVAPVCPNDSLVTLAYTITAGTPTTYSLAFNKAAKDVGFKNQDKQTLLGDKLTFPVPIGTAVEGQYSVQVTMYNALGCASVTYAVPFALKESNLITKLDYATLAVDSAGIASFEWYRNAVQVGANTFFYHENNGALDGTYKVVLTDRNGHVTASCPTVFHETAPVNPEDTVSDDVVCNNTALAMLYVDGVEVDGFVPNVYRYTVLLPIGTALSDVPTADAVTATLGNGYQTYTTEQIDSVTVAVKVGSLCVPIGSGSVYTVRFEIDTLKSYTLTTLANDPEFGDVAGGGIYKQGTAVEVLATAVNGYEFAQWSDGLTANPRTVVVTCDTVLKAIFEPYKFYYTITALPNDTNFGSVAGGGVYLADTEIVLEATPKAGYELVQWSDGVYDNPRTVVVTRDFRYVAQFRLISNALTDVTTGSVVYVQNDRIFVECDNETDIFVYNSIGQLLDYKQHTTHYTVRVPVAGVYLVHIGTEIVKVIVH